MEIKFIQKALIKKQNKYLVLQRSLKDDSNPGKWDFPGGNIGEGEDLNTALAREVFEEAGLTIKIIRPLKLKSFVSKKNCIAVVYETEYVSGDVKISDEHNTFKWVSFEELKATELQDWLKDMYE